MARTLRRLGESSETGAPLGLVLCTGDSIDNAQANELANFTALLSGGVVRPRSGGPDFEGVQAPSWQNPLFWHPDPGDRPIQDRLGLPRAPGTPRRGDGAVPRRRGGCALAFVFRQPRRARARHRHPHPRLPVRRPRWPEGRRAAGRARPARAGGRVPLAPRTVPHRADPPGGGRPDRRIVGRSDFVAAHLQAAGLPRGHGFGPENLATGTAYGVHDDVEGVRIVLLDSTNLDGHHHGSIGRRQMRWLEERLVEVHSRYRSAEGAAVTADHVDRLVVLASHHGLATLSNSRQDPAGAEEDHPRATAAEVRALLHRFDNVVLWLNGHRHLNEVVLWPSPRDPARGFWEVSTAAMADWPCQARIVELVAGAHGTLSVLSTMLDHDAPPEPEAATGLERLASLHRELAANVPGAGLHSQLAGRVEDRNVELVMSMPFSPEPPVLGRRARPPAGSGAGRVGLRVDTLPARWRPPRRSLPRRRGDPLPRRRGEMLGRYRRDGHDPRP